jgi:hypothetical protein
VWGEIYIFFGISFFLILFFSAPQHLHSVTAHDRLFFNQLIYFTKGGGSKSIASSE